MNLAWCILSYRFGAKRTLKSCFPSMLMMAVFMLILWEVFPCSPLYFFPFHIGSIVFDRYFFVDLPVACFLLVFGIAKSWDDALSLLDSMMSTSRWFVYLSRVAGGVLVYLWWRSVFPIFLSTG